MSPRHEIMLIILQAFRDAFISAFEYGSLFFCFVLWFPYNLFILSFLEYNNGVNIASQRVLLKREFL